MFGYNNYGNTYIPPVQQRPIVMSQQQMIQQPITPCPFQDVRFVNEKEADAFIVMAGQKVLLIDSANQKMWIKFADSMGTSTTETYHFERIENATNTTETTQQIDTSSFAMRKDLENCVTRGEFTSLKESIDRLEKQVKISQILSDKPSPTNKGE